jgi:hypothetical protein
VPVFGKSRDIQYIAASGVGRRAHGVYRHRMDKKKADKAKR